MKIGWLEVDGWLCGRSDDVGTTKIGRKVLFDVPNKLVRPEFEKESIWESYESILMLGSEATPREVAGTCCKSSGRPMAQGS